MKVFAGMLAGVVLCAGLYPAAGFAAAHRPINTRQHSQQARITQGVKSGQLTRHETVRLEQQEARVRVNERFARADGSVTPQERTRLQRELDRTSQHIYNQKHDGQVRN